MYNYIINSRLFKFLPKFLTDHMLSNIIYFKKIKKKKLDNDNYKIDNVFKYNYKKSLKLNDFNLEKTHFVYSNLKMLINLLFSNNKINFLDYGAGEIKNYLLFKKNKKISYYYKDQIEYEKFYEKKINQKIYNNFNIYNEKTKTKFDFIYFGSSFQYLNNVKKILKSIISSKTKYILLSGTIIYEDKNKNYFVCEQLNLSGKKINLFFYNKSYLIKLFKKYGFKLINLSINKSDKFINFKNFNEKNIGYYDIFFKR